MNELLAVTLAPQPTKREHVAAGACDWRNTVLAAVRTEELDAMRGVDRVCADELTATGRALNDDVEAIVISTRHRIGVRRDAGANGVADQVAVEGDGPGRGEQKHLVVAGALTTELPAEGLLEVVEKAADDC